MSVDVQKSHLSDALLSCSICFEEYKSPKVLPCFHTFCQSCIHRHYEVYRLKNGGQLTCPACREMIPLPQKGIGGLKNDTVSVRIKEIIKGLPLSKSKDGMNKTKEGKAALNGPSSGEAEKGDEAHSYVIRMQEGIAQLRKTALQLYRTEISIKETVDIASRQAEMRASRDVYNKKDVRNAVAEVEAKYSPSLNWLSKEQDRLYKKIADIKCIHDVLEEIISKYSDQLAKCVNILLPKAAHVLELLNEKDKKYEESEKLIDFAAVEFLKMNNHEAGAGAVGGTIQRPAAKKKCLDPALVQAKQILRLGGLGHKEGKFNWPCHASFLPNGDIIVSDKNNNRMQVFDVTTGDVKGELLKGFVRPRRAKFSPHDGYLYISDELSESVKVFDQNGVAVMRIGQEYFQCAAGIDFNSQGNLIMSDTEKGYISIHSTQDGEMINKWFFRFISDRNMPDPYFLCVNEDDQIIVTDARNGKAKVFSNTGQLLFSILDLDVPRGVCVDPYGNILIAESDLHRISMFNPYGKFIQHLVNPWDGLHFPLSLEINGDGKLLVTQCGPYSEHEVLVFQLNYN